MRLVICLLTWGIFVSFTTAATIHVPADQPTIQAAIDAAMDGDTVLVAPGTYFENIHFRGKGIVLSSEFVHSGDLAHIDSSIIDGSNPQHNDSGTVVTFNAGEDSTSVLLGFTIRNGTGTKHPNSPGAWNVSIEMRQIVS